MLVKDYAWYQVGIHLVGPLPAETPEVTSIYNDNH